MTRKSKIIVSVVGIAIVFLALLGITYAYYLTRIQGNTNTNSITVSTADLKLVYGDGNGAVTALDIMPGTVIEKTFTVTNAGKSKVEGYVVVIDKLVNTLQRKQDLTYSLTCKFSDATKCGEVLDVQYPSVGNTAVIFVNDINPNVTHYYTLTVTYVNEPDIDQSVDMGKSYGGLIDIRDANSVNPYSTGVTAQDTSLLAYNIIENSKSGINGTILRGTPLTQPAKESSSLYVANNPTKFSLYTTTDYHSKGQYYTKSYSIDNNKYLVYGDYYEITEDGYYTLTNPQIFQFTGDLTPLIGKYVSSYSGNVQATANTYATEGYKFSQIYKVIEETTGQYLYYEEFMKLNYYFVYSDGYNVTEDGYYTLDNPQIFQYTGDLTSLKGKYITSYSGTSSESVANREVADGYTFSSLYKVLDETSKTVLKFATTPSLNYYVYADSYEVNGEFSLNNPKIFHNTGDITPLKGKYIIDKYGDSESAANEALSKNSFSTIYKVGDDTTEDILYYASIYPTEKESAESTLAITQDGLGTSYYYRGNVQDNYVLFNNMCWRTVRIEGDGSIKLIYAGEAGDSATDCSAVNENSSILYDENGDTLYVRYGFSYGSGDMTCYYDSSCAEVGGCNEHECYSETEGYMADYNYESTEDSLYPGLKETVDDWFSEKFNTEVLQNKIKNDKWCLGYQEEATYFEDVDYIETFKINYLAGNRLLTSKTTSLLCENEKYVENKIGAITVDEAMLAGGTVAQNKTYYLYENAQNENFLTTSVEKFDADGDAAVTVNSGTLSSVWVQDSAAARPAITLIPGTTIVVGGDGTKTNPYVIN